MSKFEKAEASARSAQQVFMPNRYQGEFFRAWERLTGRTVPSVDDRVLSAEADGIRYRFFRGRDVPLMVARASLKSPEVCTVGFSGSEWCEDYADASGIDAKGISWETVGKQMGRISLIAPKESDVDQLRAQLNDNDFDAIEVATALPNLVSGLGRTRRNIRVGAAVVGCVESAAAALGIPGVDLVSSGETLRRNGFIEVEQLSESWPVLVTAVSGDV